MAYCMYTYIVKIVLSSYFKAPLKKIINKYKIDSGDATDDKDPWC